MKISPILKMRSSSIGFWVLRRGVPRALLALLEPFFFWPGDFPRLFAPSEEPVDGVAKAAELVAVVVEGDTWTQQWRANVLFTHFILCWHLVVVLLIKALALTSTSETLLTFSLKGLPLMCWSYKRRANENSPSFGMMYTNS